MMRSEWMQGERGQVLIQVAISLVVLLGFAALAIDVGHLYSERRRMQNAADAGALAGARQLCLNRPDQVETEASRYMQENGDTTVNGPDIAVEGHIVRTTAHQPTSTFLARVISPGDVDVGANAAAACGAANSACGLWPIAFEQALWPDVPCGFEFVVWNDETQAVCQLDKNGDGELEDYPICDCYDCDTSGDGEADLAVVTETSRGWLDLSAAADEIYTDGCTASGCGTSELTCQIRSSSGARVSIGACIAGTRGVRAGVKDDIDARAGEAIGVPLYDDTNCGVDNNCEGTDAESYHISGLGCIRVVGWEQNFTLEPTAADYKQLKGKAIIVAKDCSGACYTTCGGTTGEAPEPWEIRAVSLTE